MTKEKQSRSVSSCGRQQLCISHYRFCSFAALFANGLFYSFLVSTAAATFSNAGGLYLITNTHTTETSEFSCNGVRIDSSPVLKMIDNNNNNVRRLAVELRDPRDSHEHIYSEQVPVLWRDDQTVTRPNDSRQRHSYATHIHKND